MIDFVKAISNASDNGRRVRAVAEARPQPHFQDVLEDGGGDGDADCATGAAEGVGRRGDDGLVLVRDGGHEGEQGDGQHAAVAEAEEGEVDEGLPGGRGEGESGGEATREDEDSLDGGVEERVAACAAHDEACADGAERAAEGLRDEAHAGLGGGQAFDLEEDWTVKEERVDRHGGQPVCQAGGEDGAVEEEADGDDGFGCDAVFDIDEEGEGDERKGDGGEDEGVRPGDLVAAGVETYEEKNESDDQGCGAEEVDAFPGGFGCLLDGDLDDECDDNAGCDD